MRDPFNWPRGPFPARLGGPAWDFTTGVLPPGLTFTRAGGGGRINSSGLYEWVGADVPRFDYDPVTLACKGLLIEESRTNLLTYSSEFNNAAWVKANSTIDPNSIAAPTGAMTAHTLVASETSIPFLTQGFSVTSGTIYTASCFFKKKDVSRIAILFFGADFNSGGGNLSTTFDLDAGSIVSQGHTTATITNAGGGWYRCAVSHLATATKTATVQLCRFGGASTTSGFGTYVWGAQVEAGSFPTTYIPTTTAAATRAADAAFMAGANFSRWFNLLEGTWLLELSCFGVGQANGILFVQKDSAPPRYQMTYGPTGVVGAAVVNDAEVVVAPAFGPSGAVPFGTTTRVALAYKANDFACTRDGLAPAVDTSGDVPLSVNIARFGIANNVPLNGHLKRVQYWPKRLSNTLLQEATT